MPPALAAVGATTIGSLIAKVAFSLALNFVVGAITKKLSKPKRDQQTFQQETQGRRHIVRSAISPQRVIYGKVNVSGTLVFAGTTGDAGEFLHMVVAIAGHPIEAVDDIFLNDKKVGTLSANGTVTTGQFADYARFVVYDGTQTEAAAPMVSAFNKWTEAMIGTGIAYVYMRLEHDKDNKKFPGGVPTPRFTVRGKNDIYDPRDMSTGYTANAALCARDYLVGDHGYDEESVNVDDTYVSAAANLCDQTPSVPGGGTEPRYECNGSFTRDQKPVDVMEQILQTMGGVFVQHQGKWRLHGAEYITPTRSSDLTEDDLVGNIRIRPRAPRSDLFNAVKGTYVETSKWQPTDFPAVTSATFEASDGGERIYRDVEFNAVTSVTQAQRLARIELLRHRETLIFDVPLKLSALDLATWDVVPFTISELGWSSKPFRVLSIDLDPTKGLVGTFQEEASASYADDLSSLSLPDIAENTDLTDPTEVSVPGNPAIEEQLYQTQDGSGIKVKACISWVPAPDNFIVEHQLQVLLAGATEYVDLYAGPDDHYNYVDAELGIHTFRVRSRNALGFWSDYASTVYEVQGVLANPAAVTGVSMQGSGSVALLAFDQHPELDVLEGGRIEIRQSNDTVGANISSSARVTWLAGNAASAILPNIAGTYFIIAEDQGGRRSTSTTFVYTGAAAVTFSDTSVIAEHLTGFLGSHTGTAAPDANLILAGTTEVDDWADWDAIVDVDNEGGIQTSGTYVFANAFDQGSVKPCQITIQRVMQMVALAGGFDARVENIDDWEDFDGAAGAQGNLTVQERHTDDDPTGSPSWSDWSDILVGEFNTRAFQFRALLSTDDSDYNVSVSTLGATLREVA